MHRKWRLSLAAALIVVVVGSGCASAPTILTTGAPTSPPTRPATPAASRPPPASTPSTTPAPRPVNLKIHDIAQEFTTPLLEATTDGDAVIWSSGAPDGHAGPAPDLWRYVPGDPRPERIFESRDRDATLALVGGDGAGSYAFVEQNPRTLGDGGWRLWYLSKNGPAAMLVDEGDVVEGVLPFFDLSTDRLVWAVLHEAERGVESQLLEFDVQTGDERILLVESPETSEIMFPSLDGDRLVYSVLTANAARTAVSASVYLIDLTSLDAGPALLSGDENAFMGVIHGDWVVWQRPLFESPLNGGELVVFSLATRERHDIQLGEPGTMLNYHTVGNRYVAADSETVSRLYTHDLYDGATVIVEDLGNAAEGERVGVDVRPRIEGDLLVFVRGSDNPDIDLVLKWAALPPMPQD